RRACRRSPAVVQRRTENRGGGQYDQDVARVNLDVGIAPERNEGESEAAEKTPERSGDAPSACIRREVPRADQAVNPRAQRAQPRGRAGDKSVKKACLHILPEMRLAARNRAQPGVDP